MKLWSLEMHVSALCISKSGAQIEPCLYACTVNTLSWTVRCPAPAPPSFGGPRAWHYFIPPSPEPWFLDLIGSEAARPKTGLNLVYKWGFQ